MKNLVIVKGNDLFTDSLMIANGVYQNADPPTGSSREFRENKQDGMKRTLYSQN
jgi:hypothetical protein